MSRDSLEAPRRMNQGHSEMPSVLIDLTKGGDLYDFCAWVNHYRPGYQIVRSDKTTDEVVDLTYIKSHDPDGILRQVYDSHA